jgi:hypothetical protein
LGDIFWRWAHFFLKNIVQIISARFGLLFVLKFPNYDQKFVWAKVLIYQCFILGAFGTKLGAFFTKRLVTLSAASENHNS